MYRGYIKLHRRLLDSAVFTDPVLLQVWIYFLLKANHEEKIVPVRTGRGQTEVTIKPGQFIFGRKQTAQDLNLPPSTIRNKLTKLVRLEKVGVQPDTHFSVVTVINWEAYQQQEKIEDRQQDRQRTGKGQAKDTNKNDKNDKNDKNELFIPPDWVDIETWKIFIANRKHKVKATAEKPSALQLIINKLEKWRTEGYDSSEILEVSATGGYAGVFKPKTKTPPSSSQFAGAI